MTREEKTRIWKRKIEQFNKSGLSMRQWCRENGEVYSTFRDWKTKININHMNEATDNQTWVSVDLSEEKNLKDLDNTITIKYMEYAIEVTNDFNKELLADVLRVLKEI